MGFLESAVVIYLRHIYYPGGFNFPLAAMDRDVIVVEIWREAATVVMLIAIGMLAGRGRSERFAWFIYSFAVWDIFYYVFLWVFLGWPQSLMTWDILFLIPIPWVGPVLSPVIIALTMILYSMTIVSYTGKGADVTMRMRERVLLYTGCLVTIIAFTEDYARQNGAMLLRNLGQGGSPVTGLANYIPATFHWATFWIGEAAILAAWVLYTRRVRAGKPAVK